MAVHLALLQYHFLCFVYNSHIRALWLLIQHIKFTCLLRPDMSRHERLLTFVATLVSCYIYFVFCSINTKLHKLTQHLQIILAILITKNIKNSCKLVFIFILSHRKVTVIIGNEDSIESLVYNHNSQISRNLTKQKQQQFLPNTYKDKYKGHLDISENTAFIFKLFVLHIYFEHNYRIL